MSRAEMLTVGRLALAVGHRWEVAGEHGAVVFDSDMPRLALFDEYDRLLRELDREQITPLMSAADSLDVQYVYELLAGVYRRELSGGRAANVPAQAVTR